MYIKKQRLLTPGPTPLYPPALHAMMASDIHHRTEDFRKVYRSCLADLKEVMGTFGDVLLFAGSGTATSDYGLVGTQGNFYRFFGDLFGVNRAVTSADRTAFNDARGNTASVYRQFLDFDQSNDFSPTSMNVSEFNKRFSQLI